MTRSTPLPCTPAAARGVRAAAAGAAWACACCRGLTATAAAAGFVQLVSPVRFTQTVKTLYAQGYDSFLEVGPGAVLTGLVKRIEPQAQTAHVSDMETLVALRDDGRYLEDA